MTIPIAQTAPSGSAPASPATPVSLACAARAHRPSPWLEELAGIVGREHVLAAIPDLLAYSRDRAPFATVRIREGGLPASLPSAVACPADVGELQRVVAFARERAIAVIPFGAGSGVMGGTIPLAGELIVDLKRMNRILALDETDATVTVQAGMNGGQFEASLNARGFTTGHLPQSLHMSTVGGWAACRGAGQNSTRYGKIEDMVIGLEVVLPDGRVLRVRPAPRRATGPGLKDLFVGSEGILGVLTEITLRLWRLPEATHGVVLAFPSLAPGWEALRNIMQSELRPAVARLYDARETQQRTGGKAPFDRKPFLAILEFSGVARLAQLERDLAVEICERHGATAADLAPYREWKTHRFTANSAPFTSKGYFADTIEVAAAWSQLPSLYEKIGAAIRELSADIDFGAHWSHIYPEGACQYMTFRIPPRDEAEGLSLIRGCWEVAQRLCLDHGGTIGHHHGAGLFRNAWMREELGVGLDLLQSIKRVVDPGHLFVPGKLGLARDDVRAREAG